MLAVIPHSELKLCLTALYAAHEYDATYAAFDAAPAPDTKMLVPDEPIERAMRGDLFVGQERARRGPPARSAFRVVR